MSTDQSGTKPIKLRAACNQCNAAKVKCTGERSGCRRCLGISADCIYAESRVGKSQGNRSRGRATHNSSPSTPPMSLANSRMQILSPRPSSESAMPTTALANVSQTSKLGNNFIDCWTDELLESRMGSSDMVFPDLQVEDIFNGMDGLMHMDGLGSEFFDAEPTGLEDLSSSDTMAQENFQTRELPQNNATSNMQPLKTSSTSSNPKREVDHICVINCLQIISGLENYIFAELKALDLGLQVISRAFDGLGKLIALQGSFRTPRCLLMFSFIMNQVTELFEMGCTTFLALNERQSRETLYSELRDTCNNMQDFGSGSFSTFQISMVDQQSRQADFVLKELNRALGILTEITAMVRQKPSQEGQGTADEAAIGARGLEHRLNSLCRDVKRIS